jgi:ATP-dependent DNA helicase PIF1
MEKQPMELTGDFEAALDMLEKTNKNLFITGRAGTGKSTLLSLFKNTTRKKSVVLAPTGVAALNVQGQTIHSFFGFPAKLIARSEIQARKDRRIFQRLQILIIDEISMVRADMVDNIDYALRINRQNPKPFGGVQVIFFGDLFQLPPVVATPEEQTFFKTIYESPFFFHAKVFKEQDFMLETFELKKVYRQEARHFIRLLDAVRLNEVDYDDLDDLNQRYKPNFSSKEYYITLSARNALVDQLNAKELNTISTREFTFLGDISGNFDPKLMPADPILKLKLGAQVMFVRNDTKREFVNGTIGKVVHLTDETIVVQIEQRDGTFKKIEVEKTVWETMRYKISTTNADAIESEATGTFKQYPLRLAWAITIHKSQGKTFDKVIIDLGAGAFEHGQTYVALSRCRTLEGIVLKQRLRPQDIRVDERILEFYEQYF